MLKTRRDILAGGAALGALALAAPGCANAQAAATPKPVAKAAPKRRFNLKYAPHFGMFKKALPPTATIYDELKFAADQGFTAWEDNMIYRKPVEEQEKIAAEMQRLGMTMGIFILNWETGFIKQGGTLATGKAEFRDQYLDEVKKSIEVAKRVNAKWMTSLVGNADPRLPRGYQLANIIDCLRRASDLLEPHGLVMVYEPLNTIENHAGFAVATNHEMYALMKAVRSPSCKLLYDLYHSQIMEGHLIYNYDKCFDEIGYIQTGDVPGRAEPGTGEVNYRNVFKRIYDSGYTGVIGMEHGNSKPDKEGVMAVIQAYRDADNFSLVKPVPKPAAPAAPPAAPAAPPAAAPAAKG